MSWSVDVILFSLETKYGHQMLPVITCVIL
jgi:hypothetical protein